MIFIDEFKPELWFIQIDCFAKKPYKLAIEVSSIDIKIATVTKVPAIDFSLYDYVFEDINQAMEFIIKVNNEQTFGSVSK